MNKRTYIILLLTIILIIGIVVVYFTNVKPNLINTEPKKDNNSTVLKNNTAEDVFYGTINSKIEDGKTISGQRFSVTIVKNPKTGGFGNIQGIVVVNDVKNEVKWSGTSSAVVIGFSAQYDSSNNWYTIKSLRGVYAQGGDQ